MRQIPLPGFTAPAPAPVELAAYLDYRGLTCGERSLALYRHVLTKFLRWQDGRPISSMTVTAYLLTYKKAAPDTQQNVYRVLKSYCTWAAATGQLANNPFTGPAPVPAPKVRRKRRRTYTEAEVVRLLRAARPNPDTRQRWAADGPTVREGPQSFALVLLLVDSALRAEEVCRLDCAQARSEALIVLGKGGHEDRAYIGEATRTALRALTEARPDDAPLFRDWKGGRCTVRALRGIVERLCKRAGVAPPERPVHSFRHYAAQSWVRAGLADLTVMRLMRHRALAVTQLYTSGAREDEIADMHRNASSIEKLIAASEARTG